MQSADKQCSTYGLAGLVGVPLANLQANIVTTLQCGCFVGALGTGFIADKIGRRWNLILAAVMAIIGTVMQAAASGEIAAIFVGRFIAGLGVGAASMVTPLYSKVAQKDSPCAIV
jgi:MFS family permease